MKKPEVPVRRVSILCCLLVSTLPLLAAPLFAAPKAKDADKKKDEPKSMLTSSTLSGLALRNIGPALTSGRIIDLAVHPADHDVFYVAVASGGVFKTTNHGITFSSIFDDQGSYSIGCIALDPNNPNVVWVGSGENNSQRSVAYGDGVYKSLDGGATWENVGLKNSEHIGKIVVDPRDSNTVYVAAQGPLWAPGGDRGLYKTTDGGKTWSKVLEISENTGVSDLVFDPNDPDVLIASSYQRRRHVYTVINGGPEGGLHKSTDGGATWRKLATGLPSGDIGRIGLAVSPADPSVVYAIVEAAEGGGTFRSNDGGETWNKQSTYVSGSGQYYQELFADPSDVDRVYSMDVFMKVTNDGGVTWTPVPDQSKHVDNHALWIDPEDPDHLLNGNDGGLYESFDRGATWHFFGNLPVTQFYRIAVSNDLPFYYVYGGTQDNFTLGGPSRTRKQHGIANSDFFVTVGGDGFQPQVDPENPDIVYSQSQYGNLVRYDRKTGEQVDITPMPAQGDAALRWNWDSPVLISPHLSTRLYFAANRLFRSDDRGDTWTPVSGDLTRQLDRNTFPVMGKLWSVEAIAKSKSTSFYGNIVSLTESPKEAGLIYAGTDDGLLQVTEDGGKNWRKVETFAGVPERTYVSDVLASRHDANVVFAAFNNHKNGDFKPYLLKSEDRGKTWKPLVKGLPERGSVWTVEQDHVDAELLFAGTEFGLYTSVDGGANWLELEGGVPTIAVRDLAIQARENDLAAATFGRGFLILDDYSPLREISEKALEAPFVSFPVKEAKAYIQSLPLGLRDKSFQGDDYFTAPNPPFGAVFTYYLKEGLKTLKQDRKAAEKKRDEEKKPIDYPTLDALRAEAQEEKPSILITVKDDQGRVVRRLSGPSAAGIHRVSWDLRWPAPDPVSLTPFEFESVFQSAPQGALVVPGEFTVSFQQLHRGEIKDLGSPQKFKVAPLGGGALPEPDRVALEKFQQQVAKLSRAAQGTGMVADEIDNRLALVKQAIADTPGADPAWRAEAKAIDDGLRPVRVSLGGDPVLAKFEEPTVPSIADRVGRVTEGLYNVTAAPTRTQIDSANYAGALLEDAIAKLKAADAALKALEAKLEAAGAGWTPGRFPEWSNPK
jgi:photosystem II stability/assembly factor-like uncharacterized protein